MRYQAKIEELDKVLALVEGKLEEAEVSPKITISFLVAVEEIFVNVAHYAYQGEEGYVDIDLDISDGKILICFCDEGVAFDPLAKEDPDITATVEEREIGGLGIYMVKKSMDGIEYERVDNKNVLRFWKNC